MYSWDDALTMLSEVGWEEALERLAHYTDLQHRHFTERDRIAAALTKDLKAVSGCCGADSIPTWPDGCLDGITTVCVHPQERISPFGLQKGENFCLPTDEELLRIKALLILVRNCQRDYADLVRLVQRMSHEKAATALAVLDRLYSLPSGESLVQQLCIQLATPKPWDWEQNDAWSQSCQYCQAIAITLFLCVK